MPLICNAEIIFLCFCDATFHDFNHFAFLSIWMLYIGNSYFTLMIQQHLNGNVNVGKYWYKDQMQAELIFLMM